MRMSTPDRVGRLPTNAPPLSLSVLLRELLRKSAKRSTSSEAASCLYESAVVTYCAIARMPDRASASPAPAWKSPESDPRHGRPRGTIRFLANPPPTCRASPRRPSSLRPDRTGTKARGPDRAGPLI
jgi:hypothetical protein